MTDVQKNTPEQIAMLEAQEAAWAEERTWPLWDIVVIGDEVEWQARPGVNEDKDGVAQPWTAPARASVVTRARTGDEASYRALQANPGYHTVESVKKRK